jgi:hypothetical protein
VNMDQDGLPVPLFGGALLDIVGGGPGPPGYHQLRTDFQEEK